MVRGQRSNMNGKHSGTLMQVRSIDSSHLRVLSQRASNSLAQHQRVKLSFSKSCRGYMKEEEEKAFPTKHRAPDPQ